jgi:hypothetical protein
LATNAVTEIRAERRRRLFVSIREEKAMICHTKTLSTQLATSSPANLLASVACMLATLTLIPTGHAQEIGGERVTAFDVGDRGHGNPGW